MEHIIKITMQKKRKLCGQQKLVKSNFQPKSKNDEKKLITTIVLAIKV